MSEDMSADFGAVTAYGYALSKGYEGTEEEFAALLARQATVAEEAAASADEAAASADAAEEAAASILDDMSAIFPASYTWNEGAYIDENGEFVQAADFHYSSPIKVDPLYNVYRVWCGYTGEWNQTNLRVHAYDEQGNWLRQLKLVAVKKSDKRIPVEIFPDDAAYIVISCSRTRINIFQVENVGGSGIKELQIENASIVNRIGIYGKPEIVYSTKIQENTKLTAKTSIFHGGNSYCVVYQENLNGTAVDVPSTSGNGVIALRYKYFTLINNVESNVSYGTIAQKGTAYTDIDGNPATFEGGVGKPARCANFLYMTAAAPGIYRYNNISNYGMVSCRCAVNVTDSGVTFGDIQELALNVDGEAGKLDVTRINPLYVNYFIYYTLAAPCVFGQDWYWLLPVVNGFVYLESSDGKTWVYRRTMKTPFQPYAEISARMLSQSEMIFAVRCQKNYMDTVSGNFTCVGLFNTGGYIEHMYRLPGGICRPFIAKLSDSQFYLLNNENDHNSCACYYVEVRRLSQLVFYRVFEFFECGTWYSAIAEESDINSIILSGTDGPPTKTTPSTFMLLSLPNPRTPSQVNFDFV